jgi:hypothetical protein
VLNLTYEAVKPPNFIFLKAVNAAKNASLPLLLEFKTKILDLIASIQKTPNAARFMP